MREAGAIERWTEVDPAMFENTLDQEMSKYEKFKDGVEEGADKQIELSDLIKVFVLLARIKMQHPDSLFSVPRARNDHRGNGTRTSFRHVLILPIPYMLRGILQECLASHYKTILYDKSAQSSTLLER